MLNQVHINLILLCLFLSAANTHAKENALALSQLELGQSSLNRQFTQYQQGAKISQDKINFSISSLMDKDIASGHVYSILEHSHTAIKKLLTSPTRWCNAVILNVNIKSCTYELDSNDIQYINLYAEDEHYVKPEQANHIRYRYNIVAQSDDYLFIQLVAPRGPFATSDYTFIVELIPIDNNRTFIHLAYSARFGFIARVVINAYLATIGRNKIGFTVVDHKPNGEAIYIKGIEAIMERNTMRYLLAFQADLDTIEITDNNARFRAGLLRWHAFTKLFRRQLYELNENDYLKNKQLEFNNQQELQRKISQQSSSSN